MLTNCPTNTLFGFNMKTQMIESLNNRWIIENRISLNLPSSRDHATLQTVVSTKTKPEIYQVISYSIATSETHLNEMCERAKGRYNATTNLILFSPVSISLSCLAAMLEDDEDQESHDYNSLDYEEIKPPTEEESIMALKQAKDLVETYRNKVGFAIPVSFTLEGLCYEVAPNDKTDYLLFTHNRKIPAIKFLRAGKLTYEALVKQKHGILF